MIVVGNKWKWEDLVSVAAPCPNCGKEPTTLCFGRNRATVYYIPLFTFKQAYALFCQPCNGHYLVEEPKAKALLSGAATPAVSGQVSSPATAAAPSPLAAATPPSTQAAQPATATPPPQPAQPATATPPSTQAAQPATATPPPSPAAVPATDHVPPAPPPLRACGACGQAVSPQAKFCSGCGARLVATPAVCSSCGAVVTGRFCGQCGNPAPSAAAPAAEGAGSTAGAAS